MKGECCDANIRTVPGRRAGLLPELPTLHREPAGGVERPAAVVDTRGREQPLRVLHADAPCGAGALAVKTVYDWWPQWPDYHVIVDTDDMHLTPAERFERLREAMQTLTLLEHDGSMH